MEKKHKLTRGRQQFSTWNLNILYLHLQIVPQFFSDVYCITLRASQEVLFEGLGVHLRMQRSLPWCKISKGPHDLIGRFFCHREPLWMQRCFSRIPIDCFVDAESIKQEVLQWSHATQCFRDGRWHHIGLKFNATESNENWTGGTWDVVGKHEMWVLDEELT